MYIKKLKIIIKSICVIFVFSSLCARCCVLGTPRGTSSKDNSDSQLFINSPKLTLIIVLDQFSSNYIKQLKPFLHGGLKFLVCNGVNYLNAFYPNAVPSTGPGHTMLSTGTYANYHGIINNKWFTPEGIKIRCDQDLPERSAVFAPSCAGCNPLFYKYGRSAHNLLVDNLSDQLKLISSSHAKNSVWSLGTKSRATILTSGRLGNPIWFDENSGQFTSSKYYFGSLPKWIERFNANLQKEMASAEFLFWPSFYPEYSKAYNFFGINDYHASRIPFSVVNKIINLTSITDVDGNIIDKRKVNKVYTRMPICSQHICNLAKCCIDHNLNDKNNRLVLWLCIANLDKIGHIFGPNSKEAIDMVYHIDNQLGDLFNYIFQRIDPSQVLFVLTADHGIQPIPHIMQKRGLDIARTYKAKSIMKDINNYIFEKYGVKSIIQNFNKPQFYLDQSRFKLLSTDVKNNILNDIKNYLEKLPGILKTWTYDELVNQVFEMDDPNLYFKRQLFKDRSGQIIYSVLPYTLIDDSVKGISHGNLYAYNTNVPLIIYQQGKFQNKIILDKVYMYQVSVTLANILGIPRPSAAFSAPLPL